ncbi:PREDICTED: nuclear transcription factor Y subunit B-7-like [Ipomoea nil]|uniref:nuclear transcription factor Y subunit B-7-like n=1 Tax=Ipomoea nil TaxID=35883 RepID=UPI000901B4EA|nr:PREDICTED: nuclear transcription factor Y subunit B-7-like [Ipomoea nil]
MMTTTTAENDERKTGNIPNLAVVRASPESKPTNSANNNNNSKEQDRFLPIANVGRIMKKVIPGNGKISKEAKETVQECVSEFISFVTGEASDKCQREKRKTINGDDILWAITTLGFEDYVNPLKLYLNKYRELEGEKLNLPKQPPPPQQQLQQQHHVHDQLLPPTAAANLAYNATATNVYSPSPATLLSHHHQPSYMSPSDHHHHLLHQQFPNLPFSPQNSVQSQLTPQEHIDSVGHW